MIPDMSVFLKALPKKLHQLEGRRLTVIGDIGLDEYVLGDVRRISPEAPVPVLEVNKEDQRLGLSANVAQNVASSRGVVHMVPSSARIWPPAFCARSSMKRAFLLNFNI